MRERKEKKTFAKRTKTEQSKLLIIDWTDWREESSDHSEITHSYGFHVINELGVCHSCFSAEYKSFVGTHKSVKMSQVKSSKRKLEKTEIGKAAVRKIAIVEHRNDKI